ncbi:MAG: NTP transferase domain-containing protein [Candidatus Omnitrophota bacterium]|nr:NTP transferase domain-containing protein [Candidatus Omnitrophota bacterium]
MQAVILAAGKGTRMRSTHPKVLHSIFGRAILDFVLRSLSEIPVGMARVVIGSGAEEVRSFLVKNKRSWRTRAKPVLQRVQRGTGHATLVALRSGAQSSGDVLVWPGDMPLLRRETIHRLAKEHRAAGAVVSVLSSLQVDPAGYGRILRAGGAFYAIREDVECSNLERRIQEVNTGVYLFKTRELVKALSKIRPDNKKGELYLTDVIEVFYREGKRVQACPFASAEEGLGINSQADLAVATQKVNNREIANHLSRGVTFVSPDQTFVAPGVKIGQGTTIFPWTYIEGNVRIGKNCQIGPFTKIRSGTVIGNRVNLGSFVEVNRSKIDDHVQARHLSYIGDASIGAKTNIGAGTITANFDGKRKHRTKIGKNVLVGSDTVFIAPVTVGDYVRTGAGAVVKSKTRIRDHAVLVGIPARPIKQNRKRSRKRKA